MPATTLMQAENRQILTFVVVVDVAGQSVAFRHRERFPRIC